MKIWACIILVSVMLILGAWACEDQSETLYPQTMVVVAIDEYENLVTVRDFNGWEWQFFGVEDWNVGDICSCIMNNKRTPRIFDDSIENVKYSGWIDNIEEWGQ